ncbi:unnamed protein product [Paramecium primaurelia]|uniref:Uncharacterized protein n=1 Tax=Paramecium primaurelia TaxID=5886 RepID=A0A8S1LSY4_PARPR|nr:unnamed protein product [Paramecium primaurelia]
MKLVILILILTIFSTQAQTQLRGKNKFEQNDELIEMNNQYTPELQEYSLFAQLTKPLYETAPMDVMLLNHEMEIARMMGTQGVTLRNYSCLVTNVQGLHLIFPISYRINIVKPYYFQTAQKSVCNHIYFLIQRIK